MLDSSEVGEDKVVMGEEVEEADGERVGGGVVALIGGADAWDFFAPQTKPEGSPFGVAIIGCPFEETVQEVFLRSSRRGKELCPFNESFKFHLFSTNISSFSPMFLLFFCLPNCGF